MPRIYPESLRSSSQTTRSQKVNTDNHTEGFVQFDIDPSIFDEEMDLPSLNETVNQGKKGLQLETEPQPSTSVTFSHSTSPVQEKIKVPGREVEKFISEQENKNTRRKTIGDIRKLEHFMNEKGDNRPMHQVPVDELDEHIASFLLSLKKPDGTEYETTTIRNMVSSFDRKLRRHAYSHSIVGSTTNAFNLTKETLKAKLKLLKKCGKGNRPYEAESVSDCDIEILYEKGLLGSATPESTINTLWLNNCLYFRMRGVSEHYNLCWGDVTLKKDGDEEFLELNERQTKTRTGENICNIRNIKPKMFATGSNRAPIAIYKLYATQRPSEYSFSDSPFYLAPRTSAIKTDQMFLRQRIGMKKLGNIMKTMCGKAGLCGKRLTNHSARKHLVQKLRDANVPPTGIMQITGHKNVQSVTNYSGISQENQKRCSSIMSSSDTSSHTVPVPAAQEFSHPTPSRSELAPFQSVQAPSISSPSPSGLFQNIPGLHLATNNNTVTSQVTPMFYGAVLNVGSINIFNNSYQQNSESN